MTAKLPSDILYPAVGCPATIQYVTDSRAAVVVKVNAKSIVVRRVETDPESKHITNPGEPYPCITYKGQLDKPVGEPVRYKLAGVRDDGIPFYANGSMRLGVGYSISRTDYRS